MYFNKIRSLTLLIKPASCNCNLRCTYCFYFDVSFNRNTYSYGNMSFETLENTIRKLFDCVEYQVNFAFQGGEPTMRGINFYYKFHEYIEKYNVNNIKVSFSIQTNGTMLNKRWFDLFKKYNYLVGVSLDGTKDINDLFRIDIRKKGTFDSILNNIKKLEQNNISYNILCVVNHEIAKNGKKVYEFFKSQNFKYMQFIPYLEPLKKEKLEDKNYGYFLDEVFNLWYKDIKCGNLISIRYFENLLMILMGLNPESCDMLGRCSVNFVLEADGSVYPCDFYVLDEFKLGNINENSVTDILFSPKGLEFVKKSLKSHKKCISCKYLKICRTGCKRHKNEENYNKFCESYIYFFEKNLEKLFSLKEIIANNKNKD